MFKQSEKTIKKLARLNKDLEWNDDGWENLHKWRACAICKKIFHGIGLSTTKWIGGKNRNSDQICSKTCAESFMNNWLKKHLKNYPEAYRESSKFIKKFNNFPIQK